MTTPEIRNRLIDLRSRIRRARFDADTDTLDVLTAELDRVLDIYNQQRKATANPHGMEH
ncbi:hypothetical protein [Rhodococcus aetherivorans]|uniref:hypothetical protein n=1 Tax=Rhodococcus aetherivorans TaxID=191292 RepID=UPI0012DCBDB3|nr:hypothetical protein [Rhodococcus aetherivorans]